MRITERMALIYTALFLTVAVGVIVQNSDTLMAKFRGNANAQAVDDVITVYAGREQRLYVLENDINALSIDNADIQLISQPACGSVSKTGGGIYYSESTSCSGHQTFSYCLTPGSDCKVANVALRVFDSSNPVDSVANGPKVELLGFEAQLGYNARELEITNVRLGKVASSESTPPTPLSAKLAKIAVESSIKITQPEPIKRTARIEGTFQIKELQIAKTETAVKIAAITDTAIDILEADKSAALMLPVSPFGGQSATLVSKDWKSLTARMVKIDMGFQAPTVMKGIDQSPFGTPCNVGLSSETVAGGMVELTLNAACLPNSRVEIRHGKLKITLKTDHTGSIRVAIPAFEENARFQIMLVDGTKLNTSARVPELANIDRVAILWKGQFNANLHALEYGAEIKTNGDVWQNSPSTVDLAQRYGGGFISRIGDGSFSGANMVEIYSLPLTDKTKPGVIDFQVSVQPFQQGCGQANIIQSLRSRGGRLVGASGIQFKLPACGTAPQSIVLKNVVRDMIIATN